MNPQAAIRAEPAHDVSQRIREFVQDLTALAQRDVTPLEFDIEFLERVVAALAAFGGAVWRRTAHGTLEQHYQQRLDETLELDQPDDRAAHERLVLSVARTARPVAVLPESASPEEPEARNPSPHLLLLAPLTVDGAVVGVVEVVQRCEVSPLAQEGFLRFLVQMCGVAAEQHRIRQRRLLRERQHLWSRFGQFARHVHRGLDSRAVACQIANEGRPFIGCDRVSVAVLHGQQCRIEAVSGQDTVNPRANVVQRLARLATVAGRAGEPLSYAGQPLELSPQVSEALEDYLDAAHSQVCLVLPLRRAEEPRGDRDAAAEQAPGTVLGALIVEQFQGGAPEDGWQQRAEAAAEQASLALGNALVHERLFLMPLWRMLGRWKWVVQARTWPKTAVVGGLVAAALLALIFYPARLRLEARGKLQPELRREVFARMDGVVDEVRVRHGDTVEAGQVLARLHSTTHDYQLTSVLGELRTVRSQLAADKAALLATSRQSTESRARHTELAAEIEQLTSREESLQRRYELLVRQQADLEAASPIAGQVITWDVEKLLKARPVQRGEALLTVADTQGPWVLELQVPDRRIGDVLAARQDLEPELEVSFVLATEPGVRHAGKIKRVSMSAEVEDEEGSMVLVTVAVDRGELPVLRPGATVVAKIDCGRHPLGYVWFHEVIKFVQTRILFHI